MDMPHHLTPDPDTLVRTTVAVPEDLHHTASLLARRRHCSLGDVFAEGLRLLFESLDTQEKR